MPSVRSPHRRPDRSRRAELLQTAREVIAREGGDVTATRHVTPEAGLPHGMFHYWFSGKEELFEELIAEVVGELRRNVASVTSVGAADRLRGGKGRGSPRR